MSMCPRSSLNSKEYSTTKYICLPVVALRAPVDFLVVCVL